MLNVTKGALARNPLPVRSGPWRVQAQGEDVDDDKC